MRRIVPILALVALPVIVGAGDNQGKTELQQDICWQWEKVAGAEYSERAEKTATANVKYMLTEMGWTKYDYALDRSHQGSRHQQLCERYFKRYSQWPPKCCGPAVLLQGTVGAEAETRGRIDRRARIERLQTNPPTPTAEDLELYERSRIVR